MPPQPGLFPVPYSSSSHSHLSQTHSHTSSHFKPPPGSASSDIYSHQNHTHHSSQTQHGPTHAASGAGSSRMHHSHHGMIDDGKKEKRRKELAGKLGKEMSDRRDDGRLYHETVSNLHTTAHQLSTRPETLAIYTLRLLPLTIERGALLSQVECEEKHALQCAETAYSDERLRVEEEWKMGRERVRERLLEGVEERRKRAREEKEGEGTSGDAMLDSSSRPHITRKLRNKLGGGAGTSPPPTPLIGLGVGVMTGAGAGAGNPSASSLLPSSSTTGNASSSILPQPGLISSLSITSGPLLNPHSLSVDELPSPFPLPLTNISGGGSSGGTSSSYHHSHSHHSGLGLGGGGGGGSGLGAGILSALGSNGGGSSGINGGGGVGGGGGGGGGRRRPKGNGAGGQQVLGGLGKSLIMLGPCKEGDIESDLNDIRRGNKRRRATAVALGKFGVV